jgi:hypothetical protein
MMLHRVKILHEMSHHESILHVNHRHESLHRVMNSLLHEVQMNKNENQMNVILKIEGVSQNVSL